VWDAAIRERRPEARFIPNGPPGLESARRAPFLAVDQQARRGLTPPWAFGRSAKQYRAVMGSKPVAGLFSVGVEEPYRWKDSVQAGPEVRIWALDGTAMEAAVAGGTPPKAIGLGTIDGSVAHLWVTPGRHLLAREVDLVAAPRLERTCRGGLEHVPRRALDRL